MTFWCMGVVKIKEWSGNYIWGHLFVSLIMKFENFVDMPLFISILWWEGGGVFL